MAANKSMSDIDKKIIDLATEVSESRDRRIPPLLLKLKGILNSCEPGSKEAMKLRSDLWEFNLMQMLLLVLRHDYSIIEGEWETAAQLASIHSQACVGMSLSKEDRKEFEDSHLPRSIEYSFLLARKIQAQYVELPRGLTSHTERTKMMQCFQQVLDSMTYLCGAYISLCLQVLRSPWLLQLLLTDNKETVVAVMHGIEKILKTNGHVLTRLDEKTSNSLLDELVYKLTVNNDAGIGASAARCLVKMCEYNKFLVETLINRYRGLRPLLRKWHGKISGRDLKALFVLLDSGSAVQASNAAKRASVVTIQAVWRGYITRQKLRKANTAFQKFQKTYRLKRDEKEKQRDQEKLEAELKHQMCLQRQQALRQFKERRLQALEILPAGMIERYMDRQKAESALRIQTLWRGHKARQRLPARQEVSRQVKAAIRIQRAVRKWLERLETQRQEFPSHLKPAGLTDERRVELQEQVIRWREERPTPALSQEELLELHQRAGQMLSQHYANIRQCRKRQYKQENLLARLDTDSELLMLAPPLSAVTEKDVEMYSSRSLPVATKAKEDHNRKIQHLTAPWWRFKEDEDEDKSDVVPDEFADLVF